MANGQLLRFFGLTRYYVLYAAACRLIEFDGYFSIDVSQTMIETNLIQYF